MDTATIHRRRWGTLAVLCVSLFVIGLDNTILNVALPKLQRDLDAASARPAVDRRRLHPGLRRPAAHRRHLGDRFGRKRALSLGPADLRLRLAVGGVLRQLGRAHRGPGGDGHRRRADHAGAPCPSSPTPSPKPAERKRAIGIWAAVSGHRHRRRPGARRLAARALLVGLGVPAQRAGGAARHRAGAAPRARVQGPERAPSRPGRRAAVRRRPGRAGMGDHRGAE